MYRINKVILLLLFVVFSTSTALAQAGYSPYTIRGIGDLAPLGLAQNVGMGGVGISNGGNLYYNNANPALLPLNNLSVFSIGMNWEYKEVATSELSQENYGGGFNHLLIGLPLIPNKWSMGLGLMPYSVVNYKFARVYELEGDTDAQVGQSYEGSGGFDKVFISNGVRLHKNFSAGLTLGYLFGSRKSEVMTQVRTQRAENDSTTLNNSANGVLATERLTIGGLYLMGGLVYKLPVKKETSVNFGVTYELGGDKNSTLYRNVRNTLVAVSAFANDTISERKGDVSLPSTLGFGVSYVKDYHWTVGVDILVRNWSDYSGFKGESGEVEFNENLSDNYKLAVGAEYTPDVTSVNSYLKRATYRLGLNYEKMPYNLNNEDIKDFGINFGVSLPVRNYSSFDLGFRLGQRGTTEKDLIQERYFQVSLGVTFNDRWFVRRRFD